MEISWLFVLLIALTQQVAKTNEIYNEFWQTCKSIENKSPSLRLKRHLFCEYDPGVRPTIGHQAITNVTVGLLPKLLEFDEWRSTMTLHTWMTLFWYDAHLTWNASDFEGVSSIHVRSDEIWMPDLSIFNSGDMSLQQNNLPSTNCLLYDSGMVFCIPAVKYISRCVTDFTEWPYDEHECHLNFLSWTHTGEEIDFHLDGAGYFMNGYKKNAEWDLKITDAVRVVKKYSCCPNDTYPMILYTFELKRHFHLMHTVFITPAVALSLLTLTVLWLNSNTIERIAVACVNFICHLLCIFDLHWQLPPNGINIPNILRFYRDSLALASFALILTILLRKLYSLSIEAPAWISNTTTFILNNRAGRLLVLNDSNSETVRKDIMNNEADEISETSKIAETAEKTSSWKHLACVIEWLSFFSVFLTYVINLATLVPKN